MCASQLLIRVTGKLSGERRPADDSAEIFGGDRLLSPSYQVK